MTPKRKINIFLIIFGLLTVFLVIFVIYPLFSGIKISSQDLLSQRKTLISFEAKLESFERFKNLYPQIQPDVEKISTLLVSAEVPVEFITFLENTARDCQVSLDIGSAAQGESKEDPWPFLALKMSSVSSFPNFLKFLDKLEASPYLIEVQNLNISKVTQTGLLTEEGKAFSTGDVQATLSIKVFTK